MLVCRGGRLLFWVWAFLLSGYPYIIILIDYEEKTGTETLREKPYTGSLVLRRKRITELKNYNNVK